MDLKVCKLHPQSMPITPAEKTLRGLANEGAVKWCVPYSTANQLGWWLYPPVDFDVIWRGGTIFEQRPLETYDDSDYHQVRNLIKPEDNINPDPWSPPGGRTKFTWGAVEPGVLQIWTGLILQTPPGWCLQVGSPNNFPNHGFQVQNGVIESDWMFYDIWINLLFTRKNSWCYFRRNQRTPIAQLIPIQRESTSGWGLKVSDMERDTPEGEALFQYWIDYNNKKFGKGGKQRLSADDPTLTKDSTTFFLQKKKYMTDQETS